jgi:outer membrane protein assembly factor BamD (BamD/ComL family)
METDPLYQEGLQHFGSGAWTEAVACFTQLQASYPDDARVRQFLETAQLRASAPAKAARQPASQGAWLRRLSVVGVFVILLLIAGGIVLAYQTWVVPVQAENARLARIDQLRRTAEIQTASGSYTEAIGTYQALLAEVPDDPVAKAGLSRVQQLVTVGNLYAQAQAALQAGDQAKAQELLEQIAAIDPNYRDAGSLLAQFKATQVLEQQYQAALQLQEAQKWTDAIEAFERVRSVDRNFKPQEINRYLYDDYFRLAEQRVEQASTTGDIEAAEALYQKALSARPLDPQADQARRLSQAFLNGAASYEGKNWDEAIRILTPVYQQKPEYFSGQVRRWLYESFMATGEVFSSKGDPFAARDRFAEAVRLAKTPEEQAEAQRKYDAANRLTTPTPTARPSPTPIAAGHIAPSWTFKPTGTPNPYPFQLVNTTFLPNTITGEGCKWAGVAGRFYDRYGAPVVAPTLGIRLTGPTDQQGAAAGSNTLIGESGWLAQFDVVPKKIEGFIQVFYNDQPVSDLIPYMTHKSCYENLMIMDVQQVKPLPGGQWLASPKKD